MQAKDKFGTPLNIGDNICFTLNMRKDTKPMVKAKNTDIKPFGEGYQCSCEYIESDDVAWARLEKKLPARVSADRVVKCY